MQVKELITRGVGQTSMQMKAAPIGALFIWHNERLECPRGLAAEVGRTDLLILGPSVLENGAERLKGCTFPAIIVDHAGQMSAEESEALTAAKIWAIRSPIDESAAVKTLLTDALAWYRDEGVAAVEHGEDHPAWYLEAVKLLGPK